MTWSAPPRWAGRTACGAWLSPGTPNSSTADRHRAGHRPRPPPPHSPRVPLPSGPAPEGWLLGVGRTAVVGSLHGIRAPWATHPPRAAHRGSRHDQALTLHEHQGQLPVRRGPQPSSGARVRGQERTECVVPVGIEPMADAIDFELEGYGHDDVGASEWQGHPVVDDQAGEDRVLEHELEASVGQLPEVVGVWHPSMLAPAVRRRIPRTDRVGGDVPVSAPAGAGWPTAR